ncbi:MAG: helix-turn-helix domain-containing protein [Nannocystaceae bacterium]|nr:helix-turn-helix domain-containing protein [Nannocystaceae bacterium]
MREQPSESAVGGGPFGALLRVWRRRRGLSQLALSLEAGTTARYVSFLETGRARPGRDVVMRLARALSLTLRETNEVCVAAGLPAAYEVGEIDDAHMAPIRRVLDMVLANHEPFPAWAIGPGMRFLGSNRAAERVMPGLTELEPEQLIDLWCTGGEHADAQARARATFNAIGVLRHELHHHPHPALQGLLQRAQSNADGLTEPPELPASVALSSSMTVDGHTLNTVATVLRFDRALDVTMSEIRVELVYPADDATDRWFRQQAAE